MTRIGILTGWILLVACRGGLGQDVPLSAARAAEAQRIETIERVSRATIAVFGAGAEGGGSGVLVSPDGYALTNYHVVAGAGLAMRCGLDDGSAYDAVLVGLDPTGDLAVIKLLGRDDFPYVPWGDSDAAAQGDPVLVVGNPLMLADDFRPTVTYGILSGVGRYQFPAGTFLEYTDALQTDAAINPGNSGGPLFNAAGELIGVNGRASFEKRGRVSVGVGYAISSNQARKFFAALKSGRLVDHASWGTIVAGDDQGEVAVAEILDDCDAARRGLRFGDVIVEFAGRRCSSPNALKNILGVFPAGYRVPVVYRREGETRTIEIVLDPLHASAEVEKEVAGLLGAPAAEPPSGGPPIAARPREELPESIAAVWAPKPGFVNYHFNRLERDRLWRAHQAAGGAEWAGPWGLELSGERNAAVRLAISDDSLKATLGERQAMVAATEWADPLAVARKFAEMEAESGLPLAALAEGMALWQRFEALGPEKFGTLNYLGAVPPPGGGDPVDVLEGFRDATPCWFYFAEDGRLVALEWAADVAADRWQLRIPPGAGFPRELRFGRGGETLVPLVVRSWERSEGGPQ